MPKIYHTTMNVEGTVVYLVGPDLRVPIDYASVEDKGALNVSLGRLLRLLNASAEMVFPESGDLEGPDRYLCKYPSDHLLKYIPQDLGGQGMTPPDKEYTVRG